MTQFPLASTLLLVTLASAAGTFQPSRAFANNRLRPNARILVLQDVPGEDRTMDSYNTAINRAFQRAAAKQTTSEAAHDGQGDTSMLQYIMAMNKQQAQQPANGSVNNNSNNPPTTGMANMNQQVDSAMASYMAALSQREAPQAQESVIQDAEWTYETERNDRPRDQKEMMAYMEAMEAVQHQGEPLPVESERHNHHSSHENNVREPLFGQEPPRQPPDEFVPNVEDLSSQFDALRQEQRQQQKTSFVPPMGQSTIDNMQDQVQNNRQSSQQQQQQQRLEQQQQQQQKQSSQDFWPVADETMNPDPVQDFSKPENAQTDFFQQENRKAQAELFQQTDTREVQQQAFQADPQPPKQKEQVQQQAFQPDPQPPKQKEQVQQQAFQPDPEPSQPKEQEAPKVPQQKPAAAGTSVAGVQYYKKSQTKVLDPKYHSKVPRIADMYAMGPPPEDTKEEMVPVEATPHLSEPRIIQDYPQHIRKAPEEKAAAAQSLQPDPEPASVPKAEKKVEQKQQMPQQQQQQQQQHHHHQQQQQQPQYYKKPGTGRILDPKYHSSVPRIADMYAMGPPPVDTNEEEFPVEATPHLSEPRIIEDYPQHIEPAAKSKEPTTKTDPEELMAAQIAAGLEMPSVDDQSPADPAQYPETFQNDEGFREAAPPPKEKKAFIAAFPNFASFESTDATQDNEYDAYGNLKRKPGPPKFSNPQKRPQPQRANSVKQGSPPPDMVIPAVSQLPDWAQNSSPEMGNSVPTAPHRANSVKQGPPPPDMVIPAVSQLPDWAQNPFPAMGNSQPTVSLGATAPAPAGVSGPSSTNFAPAPADLIIPAVSQLPDWVNSPLTEMGNSQPTASMGATTPAPAPASQDLMIPTVTHQQMPAWAQESGVQMGSSQPTESLKAMGQSPTSFKPAPAEASNDSLIGCSIEAYSDLPDWVLESQQNGPKSEVIDETFVDFDGKKPRVDRTPRPVENSQGQQEVKNDLGASRAPPVTPVQQDNAATSGSPSTQDNAGTPSTAVAPAQEVKAGETLGASSATPVTPVQQDNAATSGSPSTQDNAGTPSMAVAPAQEVKTGETQEVVTSQATKKDDAVKVVGTEQETEDALPKKSAPKARKPPAEEEHHSPFIGKVKVEKDPPKKEKARKKPTKKATVEQQDAFAAYMDVMAPMNMNSAQKSSKQYDDPMDVFNEMMAPQQDKAPTVIPSFGASSVDSFEEVVPSARRSYLRGKAHVTKKSLETPTEDDALATEKPNTLEKGDATQAKTSPRAKISIPWVGDTSIHTPVDDALDAYLESMQPTAETSVALVGEVSIGHTDEEPKDEVHFSVLDKGPTLPRKEEPTSPSSEGAGALVGEVSIGHTDEEPKDEVHFSVPDKGPTLPRTEEPTSPASEGVGALVGEVSIGHTGKEPKDEVQFSVPDKGTTLPRKEEPTSSASEGAGVRSTSKAENAPKREPIVASKQDVTPEPEQESRANRVVGGMPRAAFPKKDFLVNAFRRKFGSVASEEKDTAVTADESSTGPFEALMGEVDDDEQDTDASSPGSNEALMAEVDDALSIYKKAMSLANKGADLRETVQHVLDAETGPLSGWKSVADANKERLFGGKDDAIRAHNHMKEMQREKARQESIKAFQQGISLDGSTPFFMNLNEPTMLMMDLKEKNDAFSSSNGPSLMISRDSDVVESILLGKPDLSTNILDSHVTSGRVKGDDIPRLEGAVQEEEDADGSCDVTEQILKNTEISEGYSAWDAFQKLEAEWNSLEASESSRYDTKWLRKVQNGVPPPYQFVTEDATWSQPHCWDKLRAQKNKKLDYDVIVAGGSVGIFFAMALQLKGMVVCVVEGADLVDNDADWKVSMEELLELKGLGILTQDDLEAAVELSPKSTVTQAQGGEVNEAMDVFVSPSTLIERVAERFKSGGGTILEQSPMMGIAISEYTGAAVNLGEGREPITASLVLDCIGEKSPIARQRRYGRVPDGVCAVVGSCAAGFRTEEVDTEGGDMVMASKKTELGQERKHQYFWESLPKNKKGLFKELEDADDTDAKTTYMFTYVDGDDERPPFKTLMDDYWRRLAASQQSSQKPTELDLKRVMFAYFPTYKNSDEEPQWNRILDLGGLHDSLAAGGLSPMIPHLGHISKAIFEALDNECLHKDDLAEINAYIPSLSATWMFKKTLAGQGDEVKQEVVKQLLAANSNAKNDEELGPLNTLQDAASLDSMLGSMANDPSLLTETVRLAGLPKTLDWMKAGSMMSVYDKFDKSVTPQLEEKVEKLEPRQRFRWRRRLEAWKIGSGRGFKKDRKRD